MPETAVLGSGRCRTLTVLFRPARALEKALAERKAGKPLAEGDALDPDGFEEVVGVARWAEIEEKCGRE